VFGLTLYDIYLIILNEHLLVNVPKPYPNPVHNNVLVDARPNVHVLIDLLSYFLLFIPAILIPISPPYINPKIPPPNILLEIFKILIGLLIFVIGIFEIPE